MDFAPTAVASLLFCNRYDASGSQANTLIVAGGGTISVIAQNSTPIAQFLLSADMVQQYAVAPFAAPAPVDASWPAQDDETNRQTLPRYVRITAAANIALRLREVFVLDSTMTNKAVNATAAATIGSPSQIVDGVMDYDTTVNTGSQLFLPASANGQSVTIDLGGVKNLTALILFHNKAALPSVGYTVNLLNWYGVTIGNYGLAANRQVLTLWVNGTTFAPTPTSSPTSAPSVSGSPPPTTSSTPTVTKTVTTTASNTFTRTNTPSITPSSTNTPTGTPPPSGSMAPTRTSTATVSVSGSPTSTVSVSGTPTSSMAPTTSDTPSVSASQTGTPSPSSTGTGTAAPTSSSTGSLTAAPSMSGSKTRVPTPSKTKTKTATRTKTKVISTILKLIICHLCSLTPPHSRTCH